MSTQADLLLAVMAGRWKVTLPTGAKGKPDEYAGADLVKQLGKTPWFKANAAATGIEFRAPVNGVTTDKSKNPRAELRELDENGKGAAWSATVGVHTLTVVESFDELPKVKPHLVGAQIHDAANDVSVWRLEGTNLYVTEVNDDHAHLVDAHYVLGTRFEATYIVMGGKVRAYYNGALAATINAPDLVGGYFKAGAYTQANPTNSSPVDTSNAGQTTIYSLAVAHTPTAGPVPVPVPAPVPTPVPTPTPTPVPPPILPALARVIIIRHGEKPADKNDHTLTPQGKARALALPPLFTKPRADLYRPDFVFASKGATTSMRMLQTAQPTAAQLGLGIDTRYDSENAIAETAKLLADQAKAGKVVLAVLEHSCIGAVARELIKALGGKWTGTVPSDYPDARFDQGWKFELAAGGAGKFSTFDESVLPGDVGYKPPVVPPPVVTPPVVVPPVVTPPVDPPVVDPPPVVVDPPVVTPPPVVDPPVQPTPVIVPAPPPAPPVDNWMAQLLAWLKRVFG